MNLENQRLIKIPQILYNYRLDQKSVIADLFPSIIACTRCKVRNECSAPVTASGNLQARVMILGRNPGKTEDKEGAPFLGPGGQLLDNFIRITKLDRNDLYITNMIKCHTESDRKPEPDEIMACNPWFVEELKLVRPKLLLAFGEQAATYVTGLPYSKSRLAITSRTFDGFNLHIIACIHPGAPLHNSRMMKSFNDDAHFVRIQLEHNPLFANFKAMPV